MSIALPLLALLLSAPTPDLGSELATRYRKWDTAYRANDAKTLESMLHKQFRIVTESGKVISREEYVKGLGKGPALERYATTILRHEGTRTKAYAWTSEISKKPGEEQHLHKYRDAWIKSSGHWLLYESLTISEE